MPLQTFNNVNNWKTNLLLIFIILLFLNNSCSNRSRLEIDAHTDNLSTPRLAPSKDCSSFLIVTTEPGGLGHRLLALAMAVSFLVNANSTATLVIDSNFFSEKRGGELGESFEFAVSLLGLQSILTSDDIGISFADGSNIADVSTFSEPTFETLWGRVLPVPFDSVEDAVLGTASTCGIVALLPCGHARMCRHDDGSPTYCFASEHVQIAPAKSFFSRLFSKGTIGSSDSKSHLPHTFPTRFMGSSFNVVWHIRNDDIVLTAGGQMSIHRTIDAVLNAIELCHVHARYWIVAQNPITPFDQDFGILHSHSGFNATFLTTLTSVDAFLHLAYADVLIHTGSTFALSAALVAHSSQVFLYGKPKESIYFKDHIWHSLNLPGSIALQPNGTLIQEDIVQFIKKINFRIRFRGL